ncbi:MAG: AAA family ATPase [Pseudomonadota bacterium]
METQTISQPEAGYVSGALTAWSKVLTAKPSLPFVETFHGAYLDVDVSGSTDLTQRLSRTDPRGGDKIHDVLTGFFTRMIEVVERWGGTVMAFEGDSLSVGWLWSPDAPEDSKLAAACACAVELNTSLGNWEVADRVYKLRMAIGVGGIDLIHIGEWAERTYLMPSGPAVEECKALCVRADAGEVMISSTAAFQLGGDVTVDHRPDGTVRLVDFPAPPTKVAPAPAAAAGLDVGPYLPSVLRRRLSSSLAGWVGEMRTVTVAFIRCSPAQGALDLPRCNQTAVAVKAAVARQAGEVLRLGVEDRTLVVLAVFGLPGQAHEDDAPRAVSAVEDLRKALEDEDFTVSCGLATGKAFCGPVGPERRRDYTVLGPAVNVAARLGAVAAGRSLADDATFEASRRTIHFDGPWPFSLAGIRRSVQAHIPLKRIPPQFVEGEVSLHGREDALETLLHLAQERRATAPALCVVEGEPGVGKSALIATMTRVLRASGGEVLVGSADATDPKSPYLALRPILKSCLFGEQTEGDREAAQDTVRKRLQDILGDAEKAPLLNEIFDLRFAKTRLTASLPEAVRAENTQAMLAAILAHALDRPGHCLVIEDVHWMDDRSWGVLARVAQANPPGLVLLSSRSRDDLARVQDKLDTLELKHDMISLSRLSETSAKALAEDLLEVGEVQKSAMAQAVAGTSDGNPLFVHELCLLLNGQLRSGASPVAVLEAAQGRGGVALPHILSATIQTRLDTLDPDDQMLLKWASVLGLSFDLNFLRRLPMVRDASLDLDAALARISDQRLLSLREGRGTTLAFRHQVIRDLVYDGLLSDQRAAAHVACAQAFEGEPSSQGVETLPVILSHWRNAGRADKVISYLDQVAALRLRQYDSTGAKELLDEFFGLLDAHPSAAINPEHLATAHLMHARACGQLGLMALAEASYTTGLSLAGYPLPVGKPGLVVALLRQVARQTKHRLRGGRDGTVERLGSFEASTAQARLTHQAALAYESLTRIYYFSGRKPHLLHAALSAANLAGSLGQATPALAVNYASLGAICGVIPWRSQADHYLGRAAELAQAFDEPSTIARVSLLSGLYATSTAKWEQARAHYETGLEMAHNLGDTRLWCENAVGLETISGPWLLTATFQGHRPWAKLVDAAFEFGQSYDDMQVLACALLGRIRGNRVLGEVEKVRADLALLSHLVRDESNELESIHRVEGCAHLSADAIDRGDLGAADQWLELGMSHLKDTTSGMKSRTLPALTLAFDCCLRMVAADPAGAASKPYGAHGTEVVRKLKVFSKSYPIGQPDLHRALGDMAMIAGKPRQAQDAWSKAVAAADTLQMPLAGLIARERLVMAQTSAEAHQSRPDLLTAALEAARVPRPEITPEILSSDQVTPPMPGLQLS